MVFKNKRSTSPPTTPRLGPETSLTVQVLLAVHREHPESMRSASHWRGADGRDVRGCPARGAEGARGR